MGCRTLSTAADSRISVSSSLATTSAVPSAAARAATTESTSTEASGGFSYDFSDYRYLLLVGGAPYRYANRDTGRYVVDDRLRINALDPAGLEQGHYFDPLGSAWGLEQLAPDPGSSRGHTIDLDADCMGGVLFDKREVPAAPAS